MALIRLLAPSDEGAVRGRRGEVIEVDARTAQEWADGVRAERVIDRSRPTERT